MGRISDVHERYNNDLDVLVFNARLKGLTNKNDIAKETGISCYRISCYLITKPSFKQAFHNGFKLYKKNQTKNETSNSPRVFRVRQ